MSNIHERSETDEHAYDWDHGSAWKDLLDYDGHMDTATALRIAMDLMIGETHSYTDVEIRAARGMLSAIRAQHGVGGPDADVLEDKPGEGIYATRQIDIWIFG